MATVTLRVPEEVRQDLEDLAAARQSTVSDLLRTQIFALLGRDVGETDRPPIALTPVQRRTLSYQHQILELLHSGDEYEASHHAHRAEVLTKGFTLEYGDEFADISPELSREWCRFVMDVLDMFRVTTSSLSHLSADERESLGEELVDALHFGGFDFNDSDEYAMVEYVRFLVRTDRWTEVEPRLGPKFSNGNSHAPMVAVYQRMLREFVAIREERRSRRGSLSEVYRFDAGDLRRIAEAG